MQPPPAFKILHKFHLMFMNILKRKCLCHTFLRIKTHRNPLHCTNIIDRTALIKISERDLSVFFIHPHRCDRGSESSASVPDSFPDTTHWYG